LTGLTLPDVRRSKREEDPEKETVVFDPDTCVSVIPGREIGEGMRPSGCVSAGLDTAESSIFCGDAVFCIYCSKAGLTGACSTVPPVVPDTFADSTADTGRTSRRHAITTAHMKNTAVGS